MQPFLRVPGRLLVALVAGLPTGCGQAPDAAQPAPGLTILSDAPGHFPNYHDFGKVRHGERVEHTYVMVNGDPGPVVVQSLQTACQCTQVKRLSARTPEGEEIEGNPSAPSELIRVPAGAELRLTIAIDTGTIRQANTDKLSVVRMRTDSSTTPFLTFEQHVIPQRLFDVSPPEVRLDEVPVDHGTTTAIRILRGDPSYAAEIVAIASTSDGLEATLEEGYHFEDPVWSVLLTVSAGEHLGPFRGELVLSTTDDEGRRDPAALRQLPIPIHGHYVENVRLYPQALSFGRLEPGEEGVIDAYLRALVPGARVGVLSSEVLGDAARHVSVECRPRAADDRGRSPVWEVFLTTDGQLPAGPFAGRVRLTLDDSQDPLIERAFQGEVAAGG